MAASKPGTSVKVELWRAGAARTVTVVPAELVPEHPAPHLIDALPNQTFDRAGVALQALAPQQRTQLGLRHGLEVMGAVGSAAIAGIQPGDVVVALNNVPVSAVAQFEALLRDNAGRLVALLIRRGDATLYVPLSVPRHQSSGSAPITRSSRSRRSL